MADLKLFDFTVKVSDAMPDDCIGFIAKPGEIEIVNVRQDGERVVMTYRWLTRPDVTVIPIDRENG